MKEHELFTISNFAKFSRTTTDALRYYDEIGLLSPVSRGENNYRYYSHQQLALVNVIRTLQSLGMTLDEIKALKNKRTPERANELFSQQIKKIDAQIETWVNARKLLFSLQNSIHSALDIDENEITVRYLPEASIILGGKNDYSRDRNDYDALFKFYKDINKKYPDLEINYPVWGMFSKERIKRCDWIWPDRFYFSNPDGPDIRPASLYAIGYARGGYGQCNELYKRIIDYINCNNLEICGDAYEEYPLNEVCISDDKNYLIRVLINVSEK